MTSQPEREETINVAVCSDFYGCYLLISVSSNPRYKGRTYIGFTVNPNRRIVQHNRGHKAGGAKQTSSRGPWEMILTVYGFPNEICALRFEWAWQHPDESRRIRSIAPAKQRSEKFLDYRLRILGLLLNTGPWNRLPLVLRWLNLQYCREFPSDATLPVHMQILYGPLAATSVSNSRNVAESANSEDADLMILNNCSLCKETIESISEEVRCLRSLNGCSGTFHLTCLANAFLQSSEETDCFLLPNEGVCPSCQTALLWGDVIKTHKLTA